MENEKLLPCPFCGTENVEGYRPALSNAWAVHCDDCDFKGPHAYSKAEAIAAWNTRAPAELTGWQPIETAPKDGTEFLSAGGTQGRAGEVYPTKWLSPGPYTTENGKNAVGERRFQHPEGFYWAGYDGFVGPVDPAVWCPKPAPPGTTRAPADCKLADNDGKNCVLLEDHEDRCLSYDPKEVGVRLMSALGHVENCRAHGRVTDAGFVAIRSALLIADRELSRLRAPADLRSALEAETIERCAKVAETMYVRDAFRFEFGSDVAAAIRALAPTKGDVS